MDFNTLRYNLQQPYLQSNWQVWLQFIFGQQINIETQAEKIAIQKGNAISIERFAAITLSDDKNIAVLDIKTTKDVQIARNRVALREIVFKLIDQDKYHGLIVFYHSEDTSQLDYRLSFISSQTTIDEDGNISTQSTNAKRYSYVLGANESCSTAASRLMELATKKNTAHFTIKEVLDAFSVEKLTKEFYTELYNWYQWTLEKELDITFPKNTHIDDDDREKLEEQIIRLITRLLFVWFIKQKSIVPNNLFDSENLKTVLKNFDPLSTTNGNYYNAILQNLFFATLNKAIPERAFAKQENTRDIKSLYRYAEMFNLTEKEIITLFNKVPFLNGGLFECLDKEKSTEGIKYHLDGFSRNDKKIGKHYSHRAFIPNCVFFDADKGIFPLLQRYNFTIEENSPDEIQVALDPELLGKVFENLLASYNPETQTSARKQTGSFYTPREIVNYMVQQSLLNYLQTHCPAINIENELTNTQKKQVYDCLLKVKILDPACGSGAYPMGILLGIIALLQKIGVASELNMYQLKLHLIENSIYGIDIQTIAVQICKLRFFISLTVEQKELDYTKENYGVLTLPNLETNFVAANTLMPLQTNAPVTLFTNPKIQSTKDEILAIRHQHFSANTTQQKIALRQQDNALRKNLVALLEQNGDFADHKNAEQVAAWNPYDQNASSPFYDTEWMFGIKDGFDIVIGNPPYVSAPAMVKSNSKIRKAITNSKKYITLYQKWDLYIPFMEFGLQTLANNGIFSMIVPYPLTNQTYGLKLRELIISDYNLVEIVDLNGTKIFENATVSNCIPFIIKSKPKNSCIISSIGEDYKLSNSFILPFSNLVQDKKTLVWNLSKEMRESNRHSNMKVLGDFCYISTGMVLNADEKMAKGEFVKEDLISENYDEIHCRKYIEAKDIEKYNIKNIRYLEYNTDRCPSQLRRPTFRELYEVPKLMFNRLGSLQVIIDTEQKLLHSDSMYCSVLWKDLEGVDNKSISSSVKRYSNKSRIEMVELSSNIE